MKILKILILLILISFSSKSQTHSGDTQIKNRKLEIGYDSQSKVTATEIDQINGDFGKKGIGSLHGGDLHIRSFWGVVIDKNGGNLAGSGSYSNGVLNGGGQFAVRTRTSETNFRTDFLIKNDGHVGIGTMNPDEKLQVNGNIKLENSGNKIFWDWPNRVIEQHSPDGGTSQMIRFRNSWGSGNPKGGFDFADYEGNSVMRIIDYKVGIGTTNPDAKLTVDGKIKAEEVKVEAVEGADFVFKEDYNLTSLDSLQAFIQQKKHLPDIPSASQMKQQGISVGKMNIRLLQKIEELTLYILYQEKRMQKMEKKLVEKDSVISQIQALKNELNTIKNKIK